MLREFLGRTQLNVRWFDTCLLGACAEEPATAGAQPCGVERAAGQEELQLFPCREVRGDVVKGM